MLSLSIRTQRVRHEIYFSFRFQLPKRKAFSQSYYLFMHMHSPEQKVKNKELLVFRAVERRHHRLAIPKLVFAYSLSAYVLVAGCPIGGLIYYFAPYNYFR